MPRLYAILLLLIIPSLTSAQEAEVTGDLRVWHPITVTFQGPATSEDATPNPFRDYKLTVAFTHETGASYVVPGFFAADGDAANTGATAGDRWRARFTPDAPGDWTYQAEFVEGPDVAIRLFGSAGTPAAFDGATGAFTVAPADPSAPGFRGKGRLQYVGERYLRHAGSGEPFLKGGAGSPENLLAYADFDGTFDNGGPETALEDGLHRYEPHARDWRDGDPTWAGGKGKGLVGALNYLAGKGMNAVYFLTMNWRGDGDDVWPWTAPDVQDRFDVSKLAQWAVVFDHMDRRGLAMNVVLQETENDTLFDGGALGALRKLYFREMVARFGHHLGLTWNLGEENNNTTQERRAFANYLRALDPYDHPLVVHNHVHLIPETYDPLLGDPLFTGTSFQIANPANVHAYTIQYLDASAAAGRPWVVNLDEIGHYGVGVKPDADDPTHDAVRKDALWGHLMAGGAGTEWYFGYRFPPADLDTEDWRSRDAMWDQTRHALTFFREHLPFAEMRHHDGITWQAGDYVLAQTGEVYALYLPEGGTTELELKDYPYAFDVWWYNPRTGGPLQRGSLSQIQGGSHIVPLGDPPSDPDQDWAVIIRRAAR